MAGRGDIERRIQALGRPDQLIWTPSAEYHAGRRQYIQTVTDSFSPTGELYLLQLHRQIQRFLSPSRDSQISESARNFLTDFREKNHLYTPWDPRLAYATKELLGFIYVAKHFGSKLGLSVEIDSAISPQVDSQGQSIPIRIEILEKDTAVAATGLIFVLGGQEVDSHVITKDNAKYVRVKPEIHFNLGFVVANGLPSIISREGQIRKAIIQAYLAEGLTPEQAIVEHAVRAKMQNAFPQNIDIENLMVETEGADYTDAGAIEELAHVKDFLYLAKTPKGIIQLAEEMRNKEKSVYAQRAAERVVKPYPLALLKHYYPESALIQKIEAQMQQYPTQRSRPPRRGGNS